MATITVTNSLDVANKFETLVTQALSNTSAYIRAKETIQEFYENNIINDPQKAEIISNIIGNITTGITTASMSAAISWAQAEKDTSLRILELEKQLDILAQENLLKTAQTEQVNNAIRLSKVESKRMYGTATFDSNNNVLSLDNTGKVYTDMQLVTAQTLKTSTEEDLVQQKIKESYAAVHKIVADTYVNFGNYTYTGVTESGISTVTQNHGSFKTLSSTQQDIATEQAKGYVYNAWANALTGASSALGTAIASGIADFENSASPSGQLLDVVLDVVRNLRAANSTTTEAIPAYV